MKTLDERIRRLMNESGLGVSEIAAIAGVKPPSVSDWLNRKTKSLKAGPALRLSKHFGVNSLWLTEDVGPMREKESEAMPPANTPQATVAKPYIPTLPAPKTQRQQSLDEVARLASLLDDFGLHRLIGMASVLLEQHHVSAKQTHKSSQ